MNTESSSLHHTNHRSNPQTNPSPKNSPFRFNASSFDIQHSKRKKSEKQNKKHVKVSLKSMISEPYANYDDTFHVDEDELLRSVMESTRRKSGRDLNASRRSSKSTKGSKSGTKLSDSNSGSYAAQNSARRARQSAMMDEGIHEPLSPGVLSEEDDSEHNQYDVPEDNADDTSSATKKSQSQNNTDEVVYPTLQQPILLDETTYLTRLSYSTKQWHLSVLSPHFDHIEYQIHVTLAHHTRITMHHPMQPRALFELVKGALLEGAASFDYFWISGMEYMTLGNVDEMVVSQNGWKGDARAETDRLLLWVGLGRDLGYWLILEPVRVEVSAKQVLKKLRALEEEYARVLQHNKSLLIKNEVLQRQEESSKADTSKLHEEIHTLKRENGKLKQMLVNMIQHMVQKQQRMMRALSKLEELHADPQQKESSSTTTSTPKKQDKQEASFSWNPLKKHANLTLSNFCRTITCKTSPGKWESCLGDEIWTEGVHQWDIVLRGQETPQFQSMVIGVADPSHSLSRFCGSTDQSYGLFIHSGNLYHKEIPKPYIKTVRTVSEREYGFPGSPQGDDSSTQELPFISFQPGDTITVILNLNDGTLRYIVNGNQTLRIAYANLKGPLCACVSFCDNNCIDMK